MKNKVYNGNNLEVLKQFPDSYFDSIVTDPPYGIAFMGKEWDDFANNTNSALGKQGPANKKDGTPFKQRGKPIDGWCEKDKLFASNNFYKFNLQWATECFRVLKPGGFILVFGSTRMYHRMACAIEDAGFSIRDMISWVYGSGFPKSLNVGKAIDKLQGNEREVVGDNKNSRKNLPDNDVYKAGIRGQETQTTKGISKFEGWGTALKPAFEPIVVARKPLSEKSVAENMLKWGTAGINIDGCRIDIPEDDKENYEFNNNGLSRLKRDEGDKLGQFDGGWKIDKTKRETTQGRFPANLIHDGDEEVVKLFPDTKSTGGSGNATKNKSGYKNNGEQMAGYKPGYEADGLGGYNDTGSAARFFYCAKTSKSERNKGCEHLEVKNNDVHDNPNRMFSTEDTEMDTATRQPNNNHHPTVKPIKLMQYLVRLVTQPKGIVLDPFAGSGSTGCAAVLENMNYVLIEMEKEYCDIANARINYWTNEAKEKNRKGQQEGFIW